MPNIVQSVCHPVGVLVEKPWYKDISLNGTSVNEKEVRGVEEIVKENLLKLRKKAQE